MSICNIEIHEDQEEVIYYNPYKLNYIEADRVFFGTKSLPCLFIPKDTLNGVIQLSRKMHEQLLLPTGPLSLRLICHEGAVYLGPLIGIFTAGFTESMDFPMGDRSEMFITLLSAQHSTHSFAYVFGAQSINWEDGTVEGYTWEDEMWIQRTIPFPNVIYDRLPNRKVEGLKLLQRVKNRFSQEYMIPWFNPGFFNKWDVFKLLENEISLKPYLPKTIENPEIKQILNLLSYYPFVYLKPKDGSFGHGIIKCWYHKKEHAYYAKFRVEEQNHLRRYDSIEILLQETLSGKKLEAYIAQQGIKLIQEKKKNIDFRVHTNKNEAGIWHITAIAAKVAGKGSPTTHINSGGQVKTMDELNFPDEVKAEWTRALSEAALKISCVLDYNINGFMGEIGFDFGIDKSGKVWLFEGNSKPGRSIFNHPKLAESDKKTREYSFLYAYYLMEQSIQFPLETI